MQCTHTNYIFIHASCGNFVQSMAIKISQRALGFQCRMTSSFMNNFKGISCPRIITHCVKSTCAGCRLLRILKRGCDVILSNKNLRTVLFYTFLKTSSTYKREEIRSRIFCRMEKWSTKRVLSLVRRGGNNFLYTEAGAITIIQYCSWLQITRRVGVIASKPERRATFATEKSEFSESKPV